MDLPRKIWMFWAQGEDGAPELVKRSISSWRKRNPEWELIVLDSQSLKQYVDIDVDKLVTDGKSYAAISDLLRVALLDGYGGVWVDATVFCMQPLDDWLLSELFNGFFIYKRPGRGRLVSSWFIASTRGNYLVKTWYYNFYKYLDNDFRRSGFSKKVFSKSLSVLNMSVPTTRFWFGYFPVKVARVFPYFAFHYLFNLLVSRDEKFKNYWKKSSVKLADPCHFFHNYGFYIEENRSSLELLKKESPNMLKLDWRIDVDRLPNNSLLRYLLEKE